MVQDEYDAYGIATWGINKLFNSEENDFEIVNEEEQQEYLIKNRPYFIILLYFGFKIMFKDLSKIDEVFTNFVNSLVK